MSKTLLLKTDKFLLPVIDIVYKNEEHENNINLEEYDTLKRYKNKIDELNNHKMWDKAKKLSNDYELIHLPNKKLRGQSIALYEPLSRSYFKLFLFETPFSIFFFLCFFSKI